MRCDIRNVTLLIHRSYQDRTVPACNKGYDNHFIVLSHWDITPQAQFNDFFPGLIILATGQPLFALNHTLYMSSIRQGLGFNNKFEIIGLTWPVIKPGHARHGAIALPQCYQCWLLEMCHTHLEVNVAFHPWVISLF